MASTSGKPDQGGPTKRRFFEIAREVLSLTESERPELLEALSTFEGKIVQVRVVDEAEFEFGLAGGRLKVNEGFRSRAPDATLVLPPKTIIDIIEGRQTPTEAFFAGTLKVAARTDELVALQAALVVLSQQALMSPRVRDLYDEFRTSRFGPRDKPSALTPGLSAATE